MYDKETRNVELFGELAYPKPTSLHVEVEKWDPVEGQLEETVILYELDPSNPKHPLPLTEAKDKLHRIIQLQMTPMMKEEFLQEHGVPTGIGWICMYDENTKQRELVYELNRGE